jgi:DNA-binding CsgD family transcriptional regulator
MKSPKPEPRDPPVHVVLVDARGVIADVSAQGKAPPRGRNAAMAQYAVGDSYLDHCRDHAHRAEVQALLKRNRTLISFVFSTEAERRKYWFVVVGVPVGESGGAILMHIDISAWVPGGANVNGTQDSWQPETLNPALIQSTIASALARQFGSAPEASARVQSAHSDVDSLSPRQHEVLLLIAAGKTNLEIADELSCSLNTVKRHVTAVLQKLRLPNRTRAAALANELNLRHRGR